MLRSLADGQAFLRASNAVQLADAQRIRALIRSWGCRDVYLDVGSNIGVQVRKLFEPGLYGGALVLPIFARYFGPSPRCGVCAIGFEPNPRNRARLSEVEANLTAAGVGVAFFEAAASDQAGVTLLQLDRLQSKYKDAGASTLALAGRGGHDLIAYEVRTMSLATVVRTVRSELGATAGGARAGRIVMKLVCHCHSNRRPSTSAECSRSAS